MTAFVVIVLLFPNFFVYSTFTAIASFLVLCFIWEAEVVAH